MRLDRNLNLVLTVDGDDDKTYYVHSAPLGELVFEKYFLQITRTYAAMLESGGEWLMRMGPRTAALMLKKVAQMDGSWEGPEGVEQGLMNEIRRLSNVLALVDGAWTMIPLQEAVTKKMFSPSDAREVENAVTFFTAVWCSLKRSEADSVLSAVFGLFGAQLTSSTLTEWSDSLPTSTPDANSGATEALSSIPH